MTILSLAQIGQFIESNPHLEDRSEFPKLNRSADERKYSEFIKLMQYCRFDKDVKILNQELKDILLLNNDLNHPSITEWCNKTRSFFNENLFGFGLEYLDSGNVNKGEIPILADVFIDLSELSEIVKFWQLQWILYFSDYHIPEHDREDPTPPDPNDYYYSPPDPNAPSELDEIKRILCITSL